MSRNLSLVCLSMLALAAVVPPPPADARQQKQDTKSGASESSSRANPAYSGVSKKSANYAKIKDLEQKGFVYIPSSEFTHAPRTVLTRYEFAVTLQRMVAALSFRTLTQDGTKLEYTFGIPHNLEPAQAQEMLDLWSEFGLEIKQLGVEPNTYQRIRKTLEVYLTTSEPGKK